MRYVFCDSSWIETKKIIFCLNLVVHRKSIFFANLDSMLISASATDTIYLKVQELLTQYGVNAHCPIQQTVLLNNDHFMGYRFCSMSVRVDWLAQQGILVGKNEQNEIIFEQEIETFCNNELTTPQPAIQPPVAA